MAKKAKSAEVPREGVNTRITRDLREKLDLAASNSGRSVGSEIERRLERSFLIPSEFNRLLEDKATIRVLCLIAQSWNVIDALMDRRWYEDRDTLAAAKAAAASMIGSLQPQKDFPAKKNSALIDVREFDLEEIGRKSSEFIAARLTGSALADDFGTELKGLVEKVSRTTDDAPAAIADLELKGGLSNK